MITGGASTASAATVRSSKSKFVIRALITEGVAGGDSCRLKRSQVRFPHRNFFPRLFFPHLFIFPSPIFFCLLFFSLLLSFLFPSCSLRHFNAHTSIFLAIATLHSLVYTAAVSVIGTASAVTVRSSKLRLAIDMFGTCESH